MKTKISVVLLVTIIALLVTACADTKGGSNTSPAGTSDQTTTTEVNALVPVTGGNAIEYVQRDALEPRLWSGEILLSETNAPDIELNATINARHDVQKGCMSEDSQPRRQGGCIE